VDYVADPTLALPPERFDTHPGVLAVLADCRPEMTVDLLDMLADGKTPTVGWWRRKFDGGVA